MNKTKVNNGFHWDCDKKVWVHTENTPPAELFKLIRTAASCSFFHDKI
jgi:hypothetical protein